MKKIVIFIIIIVIAITAGKKLIYEKNKIKNQPTPLTQSYTIKTTHTKDATVDEKRSFLANIVSDKEVKITTKMSGTITALYVSESQKVKKGDLLLKIDDKILKTNINTLQKTLKVQQSDVLYYQSINDRNLKLYNANAISKEKLDASKLQLLSKKALVNSTKDKIDALRVDMTYLKVEAPFDGVVSTIYLHRGDLATFSKPILSLSAYAQKMQFSFATTKDRVKIGDEVLENGLEIGRVSKIYPNAKNNLNIAEVALKQGIKYRNDSYISIEVVTNSISGCALPVNAILHTNNQTSLFVFKDKKFSRVDVKVLIEDGSRVIIEPCIKERVALGSESKLSMLEFYKNIKPVDSIDEN